MSLTGSALVLAAIARTRWRHEVALDPRSTQGRALSDLVHRAAHTAFGRAHGFASIRNVRDFRDRVPLHQYADLEPWFARALAGERDVTWPGRIGYFAMSSGTTAGNKSLPISRDSIQQQRRGGFDPIATYLASTRDVGLLDGKCMLLGSSSTLSPRAGGIMVGDNTGIMALHMPRLLHHKYLPSANVRAIEDWDRRIKMVAGEAFAQDVRLLAGTPGWFPGLFDAVLAEAHNWDHAAASIADVWPNLRLLTGGGIAYEPYRPLIERRLGRAIPYVETYNATEGGIMGVQDVLGERALLMIPDNGVFYEFVPLTELGKSNPRRLALWEVDADVPYALAVSTMSGIWSYLIGDCVRFVERFPHRFLFEGRTAAFLNVQGEHVSQGEIERAIQVASQALGVRSAEFTVATDVGVEGGSAARHVFLVEFDGAPPNLKDFAVAVDGDLSAGNADYFTHRSSIHGLKPPEVRALRTGAFHQWMRHRGKLGGQNKVPRVLTAKEDRAWLESAQFVADHRKP